MTATSVPLKAGVHVHRGEIWSNIKGELLGLKWVEALPDSWPPQKRAPGYTKPPNSG